MKITWLGQSCFILKTNRYKIIIDPFDYFDCDDKYQLKIPKIKADIVAITHNHFDHNATHRIKGSPTILKTTLAGKGKVSNSESKCISN